MAYFKYNKQRIFYNVEGKGDPVLLIHGNSVSSRIFNSVIGLYSENYKVIMFDFPGHGKSSRLEKFETNFWYYNSPERVNFLIADSFLGEYPSTSFIASIKEERERAKKNNFAKNYWRNMHGSDWQKIVDLDTEVNIALTKTGKSFFKKSISDLNVPTLLTGSIKDEYCTHLEKIYEDLKKKNLKMDIYPFKEGNHPAMLSRKEEFFVLFTKYNKIHG